MIYKNDLKLNELGLFLKTRFDEDICNYILDIFKSMRIYYEQHQKYNPEMVDYEMFEQRYINTLKNVYIKFLRNVNENQCFLGFMKKIQRKNKLMGYNKDENGRFIVCNKNPQYYCSLSGTTNKTTNEVVILFDEVAKQNNRLLKETFIHELTHICQKGFNMPWYVMNRYCLSNCLIEGNAIRESKYVSSRILYSNAIPFIYDNKTDEYKNIKNRYSVYKYIYFKLEFLLGYSFMNEWATSINSDIYLSKAEKIIDSKYGNGTFMKLYQNIQIILFSFNNYSNEELTNIIEVQKNILQLYQKRRTVPLENIRNMQQKIIAILNNDELFKKEYNARKTYVIESMEFFKKTESKSYFDEKIVKDFEEEISKHTEDSFRTALNNNLNCLNAEIDARNNFKHFKSLILSNIWACEEVRKNTNHLTNALVNLETLIIKTLLKEAKQNASLASERRKYYVDNVGVKDFEYRVMQNVLEEYEYLVTRIFLANYYRKTELEDDKQLNK